jgi:hypothetical protein
MTLATDIANDYIFIDGIEDVTFQARLANQSASGSAVAGVKALARVVNYRSRQDFESVGLTSTDLVFHLWDSTLSGNSPKEDDTITRADGSVWTILAASLETLGTRWRCPARRRK